jgi:hypothetical protein
MRDVWRTLKDGCDALHLHLSESSPLYWDMKYAEEVFRGAREYSLRAEGIPILIVEYDVPDDHLLGLLMETYRDGRLTLLVYGRSLPQSHDINYQLYSRYVNV